jgi:NTP pyrophosphatase (non-canonical NTP hydrolase)
MRELQTLMKDLSEWSDSTFGDGQRNPAIVYHLKKEVEELIEAFHEFNLLIVDNFSHDEFMNNQNKIKMEFADCFILLLDSAHHFNITAEQLINLSREKLGVNKARKWGKPDINGVVEHIKDVDIIS